MAQSNFKSITIETTVNAPVAEVWKRWSNPTDIIKWNSAHPDWHTPKATNDLKVGGRFICRMEAKDGSMGFDFEGEYDTVKTNKEIAYTMADGRKCRVEFIEEGKSTKLIETFDAETENPIEMQRDGWQAILNNFKKYVEAN